MQKIMASMISKFNSEAERHMERQRLNPFSGSFSRSPSPRHSSDYGKPLAGSKTEERGKKAKCHILREVLDLCNCIHDVGVHNEEARCKEERENYDPDHDIIITFKEIFQIYTNINDKVVGLLIAAKKRGFIYFEKEILFQRQDDDVLIALIKPISEIRSIINKELKLNMPNPKPKNDSDSEEKTDSKDNNNSTKEKARNKKTASHHSTKESPILSTTNGSTENGVDDKTKENNRSNESDISIVVPDIEKAEFSEKPPSEIQDSAGDMPITSENSKTEDANECNDLSVHADCQETVANTHETSTPPDEVEVTASLDSPKALEHEESSQLNNSDDQVTIPNVSEEENQQIVTLTSNDNEKLSNTSITMEVNNNSAEKETVDTSQSINSEIISNEVNKNIIDCSNIDSSILIPSNEISNGDTTDFNENISSSDNVKDHLEATGNLNNTDLDVSNKEQSTEVTPIINGDEISTHSNILSNSENDSEFKNNDKSLSNDHDAEHFEQESTSVNILDNINDKDDNGTIDIANITNGDNSSNYNIQNGISDKESTTVNQDSRNGMPQEEETTGNHKIEEADYPPSKGIDEELGEKETANENSKLPVF